MPPHPLGQRLRALRDGRKWSLRKLAEHTDADQTKLGRLERSKSPNPDLRTLLQLQSAYGFRTVDELLGDAPSPSMLLEPLYRKKA